MGFSGHLPDRPIPSPGNKTQQNGSEKKRINTGHSTCHVGNPPTWTQDLVTWTQNLVTWTLKFGPRSIFQWKLTLKAIGMKLRCTPRMYVDLRPFPAGFFKGCKRCRFYMAIQPTKPATNAQGIGKKISRNKIFGSHMFSFCSKV